MSQLPDALLTLMVDTGKEVCPHAPPCHRPIPWLQLLGYALIDDVVYEVNATLRALPR